MFHFPHPICSFQSTPPARGATLSAFDFDWGLRDISIHAPREGGDLDEVVLMPRSFVISIHAPREGGDFENLCGLQCTLISIHAPREGGDDGAKLWFSCNPDFNPRPPRGGRHVIRAYPALYEVFQSTPPARGATLYSYRICSGNQ